MKHHSMGTSALLALVISAGLATAQTSTTPTFESTVTTGIVGWAPAAQTVQLNVLNIATPNPTNTSSVIAACPAELEIHDAQNNVLKSLSVTNVASGTATSLTLKLSDVTPAPTALRLGIRGVVKSNPIVTGTPPSSGTTSTPVLPLSFCSFVTTMELFDNSTGVTQTFTSDTRPVSSFVVEPLSSSKL